MAARRRLAARLRVVLILLSPGRRFVTGEAPEPDHPMVVAARMVR